MFKNFDFSWFLTTPGILTGVGCLLIIISIIIFLSSLKGKKNKVKDGEVEVNQSVQVPDVNPVNVGTEPINFAKTLEPTPIVNNDVNAGGTPEVTPVQVTPVMPETVMVDQTVTTQSVQPTTPVMPEVTPINIEPQITPVETQPMQPTAPVMPEVTPINIEPQITPVETQSVQPTAPVMPEVTPINIEPQITPVETQPMQPTAPVMPEVTPINIEPQITPVEPQSVQQPSYVQTPQQTIPQGMQNVIYNAPNPINGTGVMPQINPVQIEKKPEDIESL